MKRLALPYHSAHGSIYRADYTESGLVATPLTLADAEAESWRLSHETLAVAKRGEREVAALMVDHGRALWRAIMDCRAYRRAAGWADAHGADRRVAA